MSTACEQLVVEINEHDHARVEARAMALKQRGDGGRVPGGESVSEAGIRCEDCPNLRQLAAILLERTLEYTFSDANLAGDLAFVDGFVGVTGDQKRHDLHGRKQQEEKDHDAGLKAAEMDGGSWVDVCIDRLVFDATTASIPAISNFYGKMIDQHTRFISDLEASAGFAIINLA